MSRLARRASWVAVILALLGAIYAAAGFFVAPRFVRDAVLEQAAAAGVELRIAQVRTNPFLLTLDLSGVELADPQRGIAATLPSARADLAWASLLRRAWIVQGIEIAQPNAQVAFAARGEPRAAAGKAPNVTVQRLRISDGVLRVRADDARPPLELTAVDLALDGSAYDLSARQAKGTLASQGSFSLAPLAAQGRIELKQVALSTLSRVVAPHGDAADGEVQAAAAYTYENGRLVLRDVAVDANDVAYAQMELRQATLRAPHLELPAERPFELAASASLKQGGALSARGTAAIEPPSANLQVELTDVPLALAKSWLGPRAALEIASGALSAHGTLLVKSSGAPRARYAGRVSLRDVKLRAPASQELLLGWRRLETDAAKLAFAPFAAELGEVMLEAPEGQLVIDTEGRVNLVELLRGDDSAPKPRLELALRRLRIEQGTLHFADHSLESPFATTLRELSGAVSGLSTMDAEPARVQLEGRVGRYGVGRVRGAIDLHSPSTLTNLALDLRNLDLAAFTPYVTKFAGYRVESGRVSAQLRYRVRDARLVGENKLVFERVQLGEKVEEKGARDLPLELVVALLADNNGRINLEVPVRGNLNDPQFDFAGLIARAFRNVVSRIASAPFRALGALVGGKGETREVLAFEPGSVTLAPPEEQTLNELASALAERPQLALVIRGGYDAEVDAAALRRQVVRRELARRAGYDPKRAEALGGLDLRDPKIVREAEKLFLQRGGGAIELIKMHAADRPYGRVLFDRLVAETPLEPESAERLAQARGETVRAALVSRGVDPARVRIENPAPAQAENEGVPTTLALNAVRD